VRVVTKNVRNPPARCGTAIKRSAGQVGRRLDVTGMAYPQGNIGACFECGSAVHFVLEPVLIYISKGFPQDGSSFTWSRA